MTIETLKIWQTIDLWTDKAHNERDSRWSGTKKMMMFGIGYGKPQNREKTLSKGREIWFGFFWLSAERFALR